MSALRSKLSNLWYHYKAHILFGIFVIGTLVFCLHSCVTKPEFDLEVYYFTGVDTPVYSEQLDWIERALAQCCPDVNQDGTVTVAVTNVKIGTGDAASISSSLTPVQAGTVMLFLGDQEGIEYLYQNNFLQTLNEYTDTPVADGYAWQVSDSGFAASEKGFDLFDGTTVYAALRIFDGTWNSWKSSVQSTYTAAQETLRAMIAVPFPSAEGETE